MGGRIAGCNDYVTKYTKLTTYTKLSLDSPWASAEEHSKPHQQSRRLPNVRWSVSGETTSQRHFNNYAPMQDSLVAYPCSGCWIHAGCWILAGCWIHSRPAPTHRRLHKCRLTHAKLIKTVRSIRKWNYFCSSLESKSSITGTGQKTRGIMGIVGMVFSSSGTWGICTRRGGKLYKAR